MTVPIDFIRAADMPWGDATLLAVDESGRTARAQVLRSGSPGEVTAVVALAAGQTLAGQPGCLVSFLVLGGAIEVNGRTYGHLGFGQDRPDGSTTWTASVDTRLLLWQQPGGAEETGLVSGVETLDADWEIAEDAATGSSWRELTLAPPGNPAGAVVLRSLAIGDAPVATHRHEWDEEVFVVDGERLTPAGPMDAGTYAWRPRGRWHGGFRTGSPGALLLVRRIGAPDALATAPQVRADPVPARPLRREAKLLPAAASTAHLMRQRATLTGRQE